MVVREFQEMLETQDKWSDCSSPPLPSFLHFKFIAVLLGLRVNQVNGDQTDSPENLGLM